LLEQSYIFIYIVDFELEQSYIVIYIVDFQLEQSYIFIYIVDFLLEQSYIFIYIVDFELEQSYICIYIVYLARGCMVRCELMLQSNKGVDSNHVEIGMNKIPSKMSPKNLLC
jgi:hypothetical protein